MGRVSQQLVSIAVQVAAVCTVVVIGLIPLTAPLPPLSGLPAVAACTAGVLLTVSMTALSAFTLVPRWFRLRSPVRMLSASVTGGAAGLVGFFATAGLITRPLLLVAAAALLLVTGETVRQWLVECNCRRPGGST